MTTRPRTTPTVATLVAAPATTAAAARPGGERTAVHRAGRFGRILAGVRPTPAPRPPAPRPPAPRAASEATVAVARPTAPSVSARPTRAAAATDAGATGEPATGGTNDTARAGTARAGTGGTTDSRVDGPHVEGTLGGSQGGGSQGDTASSDPTGTGAAGADPTGRADQGIPVAAAIDPSTATTSAELAGALAAAQLGMSTTSVITGAAAPSSASSAVTAMAAAPTAATAATPAIPGSAGVTDPVGQGLPQTAAPLPGTPAPAAAAAEPGTVVGSGAVENATGKPVLASTAPRVARSEAVAADSPTPGPEVAAAVSGPGPVPPQANTAGSGDTMVALTATGAAGAALARSVTAPTTAAPTALAPSATFRPVITLTAHHGGPGLADGRGDLAVGSDPNAASQPSGDPVSATTSWFGLDLATTITGDPSRPTVLGPRAPGEGGAAATSSPAIAAATTALATGNATTGGGPDTGGTRGGTSDKPGPDGAAVPATSLNLIALAATGPTAPTTASDRPAGATPIPVGEQVARQITAIRTTADGTHRTVVRLDPEHLGPLTLTVSVRAGKVRLAVSGSPEALSALDASMNGLRDQLGSAGLGLDAVSLQPTSATGSGSSATDGRSGQSGAAFAATADSAGDGGRRTPDERDRATGSGPDDRGSGTTAGSSGASADPAPQVTVRTGSGQAGRVDVRV